MITVSKYNISFNYFNQRPQDNVLLDGMKNLLFDLSDQNQNH